MANKKINAIAKIERDARNFFFVKMLYGYENEVDPQVIYSIENIEFKQSLSALSNKALKTFKIEYYKEVGGSIIIYDYKDKYCYYGYNVDYQKPDTIIVGTMPHNYFGDINYLIYMISYTIDKYNLGDLWIECDGKKMTEKEFYEFQKELLIYPI